jgi:hypothetical protein
MEESFAASEPIEVGRCRASTGNELTIDRLFAVSELGLDGHRELGRRRGFEEAGGGAVYPPGYRS